MQVCLNVEKVCDVFINLNLPRRNSFHVAGGSTGSAIVESLERYSRPKLSIPMDAPREKRQAIGFAFRLRSQPTCTVWKSEVGNLNVDPLRLIQSPFTLWRMILLLVWQHRPRSTRTRILFGRFVSEVIRASGN